MGDDNAVYLGNLKNDIRISILKENIMHMFRMIGITITKGKIDVINRVHTVYAFVYLSSCDEQQHVLDLLQDNNVLTKLDLSDVVQTGKTLKVAAKLDSKQLRVKQKGSPSNSLVPQIGGQQDARIPGSFASANNTEDSQANNASIQDSAIQPTPERHSENSMSSAHGSDQDTLQKYQPGNPVKNYSSMELDPTDTDSSESADVISSSWHGKVGNTALKHQKQTKKSKRKLNALKRQKQNANEELCGLNADDIYHSKQSSDQVLTGDFFHKDCYILGEFIGN